MEALARSIDHTLLSPIADETAIRKLCEEAWRHEFKAVCVAPTYVGYVKSMLEYCPVPIEIATVVGFPLGYSVSAAKLAEAEQALAEGATELDVVINLAKFKSMAYQSVLDELLSLRRLAGAACLKVIIETAYLDSLERLTACEICTDAGADFVKTSTGFAPKGAEVSVIRELRSYLPDAIQIKASGGIRTHEQAIAMLEAGATRLGTSVGPALLEEA